MTARRRSSFDHDELGTTCRPRQRPIEPSVAEAIVFDIPISQIEESDPHAVDWDGESDCANPLNWPGWKKALNVVIILTINLLLNSNSTRFFAQTLNKFPTSKMPFLRTFLDIVAILILFAYISAFISIVSMTGTEDFWYQLIVGNLLKLLDFLAIKAVLCLGHLLDLFFARDPYDDLVPGSGFTLFIDDNWELFVRVAKFFLRMTMTLLFMASLPLIITLGHISHHNYKRGNELEAAFRYSEENNGAYPPWLIRAPPAPEPKQDTRYMTLGGDGSVIFVCGVGGGFEKVYGGDVEGAIARRRGQRTMKQFA
ncbi:hypothetical protein N0V90_000716 [Kalmusia sp. IMI 367209]|nr:hypothetical protein N0V90_000716 [Kalmusia sp. IMI 367209]